MQTVTFVPMSRTDSLSSSSPGPSRKPSLSSAITLTLTSPTSSSRQSTFKSFLTPRRKSKQSQVDLTTTGQEEEVYPTYQADCAFLAALPYEVRELVYLSLLADEHMSDTALVHDHGVLIEPEPKRNNNKFKDLIKGEILIPGGGNTKRRNSDGVPHRGRTTLTRLMRTCRQLYIEAMPILYNQTRIILPTLLSFSDFQSRIPATSFYNIRTLTLRVRFPFLLYPQAGSMLAKAGEVVQHFNEDKWSSLWATLLEMSTPGQGQLRLLNVEIHTTRYQQHNNWPSEPVDDIRDRLFAPLQAVTNIAKQNFLVEVSWPLRYAELPLPPTLDPESGEVLDIRRGDIAWWRHADIPFMLRELAKRPSESPFPVRQPPLAEAQPLATPDSLFDPPPPTLPVTDIAPDDFDMTLDRVRVARAIYTYIRDPAGEDDEIAFSKNELLRVKPGGMATWWLAKNEGGEVGLVPGNYLTLLDENEVATMRRNGVPGLPALDPPVMAHTVGGPIPGTVGSMNMGALNVARQPQVQAPRTRQGRGGLAGWARSDRVGWGWS